MGNLSPEITGQELRLAFGAFGEVAAVLVVSDQRVNGGQMRGHAFVEMQSKAAGAAAIIGLNGRMLKDTLIDVIEALPLSDRGNVGQRKPKDSASRSKGKRVGD